MTSVLLFFSGLAALVYQVLWMRGLSTVFGSSAHAAAVDLAVFFAGLAAGAALFARVAHRVRNALGIYGVLEIGIAVSALLFLGLVDVYPRIYAPLYQRFAESTAALVLVKSILALGALAVPTVLMGATLPAMAQHAQATRRAEALRHESDAEHGSGTTWLYGVNTAGATVGAFAAGFVLLPAVGFRGSYGIAVAINLAVGAIAMIMSRRSASRRRAEALRHTERETDRRAEALRHTDSETDRRAEALRHRDRKAGQRGSGSEHRGGKSARRDRRARHVAQGFSPAIPGAGPLASSFVVVLAFASGALTIGLEVAWLRMFAQVLDNSVYAFSAVVVVALVAFAAASIVVARAPLRGHPAAWLASALAAAGITAAVQGPVFTALTDDLAPLEGAGWLNYVANVFGTAALFVGVAGFAAGLVFPSLLRFARETGAVGATVGRLLTINTAGAIAGSLATTFLLLPVLGLWTTCAAIGATYASLAVWLAWQPSARRQRPVALAALAATTLALAFSPALPRLRLDAGRGEHVLRLWESAHGTVAVTETRGGRVLRLNNSYSLGGTVDRVERERIQTLIPLLLHPDPKQVFFLGLGTGITAGEAVRHPVERIVVCELVAEVVRASEEYFGDWTRGLAADPRVDIRVEDGRHYLASSADTFDVVVSDLFVPWHAGTGMLYTREHFESVRARLRPGGLFAQWLPLFQLNQRDFEVIARTLLDVFPHVVIWRGDFYAHRPIVALVASIEPVRVDPARLVARGRALAPEATGTDVLAGVLPFYAGNIGEARGLLHGAAANTDERPVIEYLSPVTQWSAAAGGEWFVSTALVRFFERLRAAVPLARDPHLAALSPGERRYVEAGALYYRAVVARLEGDDDEAQHALAQALERLPADVQVSGPFLALDALAQ